MQNIVLSIIGNLLAYTLVLSYLGLHKADHVQSSVSDYGLCSYLTDVYGDCLLFIYEL
jgi:hypothetical protein